MTQIAFTAADLVAARKAGGDLIKRTERGMETVKAQSKGKVAAEAIMSFLEKNGFPRERWELMFNPARKWRFDVAYPSVMVAIEIHGIRAHTSIGKFLNDCSKTASAFSMGWTVIPVTHKMVETEEAQRLILEGLKIAKQRIFPSPAL